MSDLHKKTRHVVLQTALLGNESQPFGSAKGKNNRAAGHIAGILLDLKKRLVATLHLFPWLSILAAARSGVQLHHHSYLTSVGSIVLLNQD